MFNDQEYIIVSDFDGTITLEDSNDRLIKAFGNAEVNQIEADFMVGKVSNRRAFELIFDVMHITADQYKEFITADINIDPKFDEFLELVHKRAITLLIVSAGFRQAVEYVLGTQRLENVEVYANDLLGEPYIKPIFATKNPDCDKPIGPCGNCKRECLKMIRQKSGRKILYIGDGITDRCVIEEVDILLAKDYLAKYCDEHGLPYVPFSDFADVSKYLQIQP